MIKPICRVVSTKPPQNNGGHRAGATLPMVSIIQQFKSYLVRTFGLRFQRDFFDTRLRDDAHFAEECNYILGNPVRKGLCATPEEWPYSIAFSRVDGGIIDAALPENATCGMISPQNGRTVI